MPRPLLGEPDIEPTWPQGPSLTLTGHRPEGAVHRSTSIQNNSG
jgi:hypothetical protein